MLFLNNLEPMQYYRLRRRCIFPDNSKRNGKGYALFVWAYNAKEIMDTIYAPMWDMNLSKYSRYHIPKRVILRPLNTVHRETIDQNLYFANEVKPYDKMDIFTMSRQLASLNGYNIVMDSSRHLQVIDNDEAINNRPDKDVGVLKFNAYVKELSKMGNLIPEHKKYLLVDLSKWLPNPKSMIYYSNVQYRNIPPVLLFKSLLEESPILKTLKGWKIVCTNVNELFIIDCDNIHEETYGEVMTIMKKMKSRAGKRYSDDEDYDEPDDVLPDEPSPDDKIAVAKHEAKKVTQGKGGSPVKKPEDKKSLMDDMDTIMSGGSIPAKSSKEDEIDLAKKEIADKIINHDKGLTTRREARIKKIQEDTKKLKIRDKTLEEIILDEEAISIPPERYDNIQVQNEELKEIGFANFAKKYNEVGRIAYLRGTLEGLAHKDEPLYLLNIEMKEVHDTNNKVEEYKCTFEDKNGKRHTIHFRLPIMYNDRFMYIGGAKKHITTQVTPKPIIKTAPDTVQLMSPYNKIFIYRFGQKLSPKITKFIKALDKIPFNVATIKRGNNSRDNTSYMTSMEYDEIANRVTSLTIIPDDIVFMFNQASIRAILTDKKIDIPEGKIPVALEKGKPIYADEDTGMIEVSADEELEIIDYLMMRIKEHYPEMDSTMLKETSGTRFTYTRAKIMNKFIPVVLLISCIKGLRKTMDMANIDWSFHETRPRLQGKDKIEYSIIKFADGFLQYKMYPISNSLLMNGLNVINTEDYNFHDMGERTTYLDILRKVFERANLLEAYINFDNNFVCPFTKMLLEKDNYPTTFTEILLVANKLLETNTCKSPSHTSNFRYRNNEIIEAIMYKNIADAYEQYRMTANNRNPKPFTMDKNKIITDVMISHVTENSAHLSPIYEMDKLHSTTIKGPGGTNLDRAVGISKRGYDPTMLGIVSQASPISASVGMVRVLSLDPNIDNILGIPVPGDEIDPNALKSTSLLSPAELLVANSATHDSPNRASMGRTQSLHTMPVIGSKCALMGSGMDRLMPYAVSDDFVFKAKGEGKVTSIDEKNRIINIQYKDGTTDCVDYRERQEVDATTGRYLDMGLKPVCKVGDKVEKGTIVAYHPDFYTTSAVGEVIQTTGTPARVAVRHGSDVYEDSVRVTEEFAEKISSYISYSIVVTAGSNTNVIDVAKKGQPIKAGGTLIQLSTSYKDEYLSKILKNVDSDDMEIISDASSTLVKSKRTGTVADIEIYYTRPIEEYSEDLQKLIRQRDNEARGRIRAFKANNFDVNRFAIPLPEPGPTEMDRGKLKGHKMGDDTILFIFKVRELDAFGIGDKLTLDTALKGINQDIIPRGVEPVIASMPDKNVDIFAAVTSEFARMTNSFNISMIYNRVLRDGLERHIADTLNKYFPEKKVKYPE